MQDHRPQAVARHCPPFWLRIGKTMILVLFACALVRPLFAAPDDICEKAIEGAARQTAVPIEILNAVALAESGWTQGRRYAPWPWTTNEAGRAARFSTRSQAEDHVLALYATGVRNIDIGCMQINLRWHGDAFGSIRDMFDPEQNALYAARYLARLHDRTGDWMVAVGAYHSRQPDRALRYALKVQALAQGAAANAVPPGPLPKTRRQSPRDRARASGHMLAPLPGRLVDLDHRSISVLPVRIP